MLAHDLVSAARFTTNREPTLERVPHLFKDGNAIQIVNPRLKTWATRPDGFTDRRAKEEEEKNELRTGLIMHK